MPPQRKPQKSPYTADRNIPGAFEGETVTRRRFMTGTAHGAGAIAASAFLLPALGFALGPVFERQKFNWQDIGSTSDFPDDTYIPKTITIVDGHRRRRQVDGLRAQAQPVDRHEGQAGPVQQVHRDVLALHAPRVPGAVQGGRARFVCPCHGGVYDFAGEVTGGPPVRPLDRFYTKVKGDRLILGPRYSVNSELKRFSPRDPGEPLDGIGQYLYPARFSTPQK